MLRRRSRRFCWVTSRKVQRTETGPDSSRRQLRLASISTISPEEIWRRSGLGLNLGRERGFEADESFELGRIHPEERLPRGIHVKVAAARAEGGDHLSRVLEEIAIAFLAFTQGMFGAAGGAEIDGDRNQAFDAAAGGAHGRQIDHGREGAAV